MLTRYFAALAVVTTASLVCAAPVFAQTDLKAAVVSLSKDIHADTDAEKLKGSKIFIAPFVNRKVKKDGTKDDTASVLIDMLSTEFIKAKHFKVVEREQMDKALKELALGESGFVDTSTAKKLGKFVGAEYGLIGTISEVEGTTLISVRLVSVETGEAVIAAEATPGAVKGTALVLVPPPAKKEDPKPAPPPGPDAIGKVAVNAKDGAELVYVPAGEFIMGSNDGDKDFDVRSHPQHKVYLDGYWIYKYPVTVTQYKKFCDATGREFPEKHPGRKADHPITGVSWIDAREYCKWAGVTLPTEAQWEKAARGTDGRLFPWGNSFDNTKIWGSVMIKRDDTLPVHRETFTSESPYGCVDMGGNVMQWCLDRYAEDYYQVSPKKNPTGAETGYEKVVRSGSYAEWEPRCLRAAYRSKLEVDAKYGNLGFRCVALPSSPGQ